MILAGDIGGTKIRLALYGDNHAELKRYHVETYHSRDCTDFSDFIRQFLRSHRVTVESACFGVAGPVIEGRAKFTNLPWVLDEKNIGNNCGIRHVKLVNDLVATTAAIPKLRKDNLLTLYSGEPDDDCNVYAVLAPGTGLGIGFLTRHADDFYTWGSEGGHADFAPTTKIQVELLQYLMNQFERVSYERVLCGQGLINIYEFLKNNNPNDEPVELQQRFRSEDRAAVISAAGIAGDHNLCIRALDIFVSILGAHAGNIALNFMATGGIFLGGGIPPKITKKLMDGTIVSAFLNKGRLSHVVGKTPLYVICDDHTALLGAATIASRLIAIRSRRKAELQQ